MLCPRSKKNQNKSKFERLESWYQPGKENSGSSAVMNVGTAGLRIRVYVLTKML